MPGKFAPATASAVAVLAAGSGLLFLPIGPLSAHMALHIALMNIAAPFAAIALLRASSRQPNHPAALLWMATGLQIVLLWAWHAPPAQLATVESMSISVLMHASLFAAALGFWTSLMSVPLNNRWQAIFALLVTGKLACLLGGLLVFAPRTLYATHAHGGHVTLSMLDDQQLAGLLMLAACPLSFVIAGIVLAAQMMAELSRKSSAFGR
jgi:putative membrane protein